MAGAVVIQPVFDEIQRAGVCPLAVAGLIPEGLGQELSEFRALLVGYLHAHIPGVAQHLVCPPCQAPEGVGDSSSHFLAAVFV